MSRFEPAAVQRGMIHSLKTALAFLPIAALIPAVACGPKVNVLDETGGTAATGGDSATTATGGSSAIVSTDTSTGGALTAGGANTGAVNGIGGAATGGSPTTTPDSCPVLTPCGGDLVGTWNVTSSCLKVDGQLDLRSLGLECDSAPVTGSLQVTGTWTANANGTFSDNTTATGVEHIALPSSCLRVSGTQTDCAGLAPIWTTFSSIPYVCNSRSSTCSASSNADSVKVACTPAASGGCDCSVTTSFKDIIGASPRAYCTSGDTLTVAPQTLTPATAGSIVLQKTKIPEISVCALTPPFEAITGQPCWDTDICSSGGCASTPVSPNSTVLTIATCHNHQALFIQQSVLDLSATGDWAARNDGISWSECNAALAGGLSGEACTFTGKTCVRNTSDSCCIEGAECLGTSNGMLKRVRICSPNCTNLTVDTSAPLVTDCASAEKADACHKTIACDGNFICSGALGGQGPVVPFAETNYFSSAMWCAGGRLVGGYQYLMSL